MTPFTVVRGPAAPLMLANVDTDVIVRIERLTQHPRHELKRYAFEALRYLPDGSDDPRSVFNQLLFRDAPILLAGANFGCGSSREGAVWALMEMGIRCVVAPSFGDIFYNNCFQNGLLPIALDERRLGELAEIARTGAAMTVDLQSRQMSIGDTPAIEFQIDASHRDAMLNGLDAIGLTLQDIGSIREWQERDRQRRPWVWNTAPPQRSPSAASEPQ